MNEWGLTTRTGKPMRFQLTEQILRDKFYAGILVDPWTGEEYEGQHKPMITPEEYYQIQRIKNAFSRVKNIPHLTLHPDFPLRRFVRCACEGKLTGSWRKGKRRKYAYYSCNNKNCIHYSHGIPKEALEGKFIEELQKITTQEETARVLEIAIIESWGKEHKTYQQERQNYERKLKRLEEQKEELANMRMDREISKEEFLKLRDKIEIQIAVAQTSKNEAHIEELDRESAMLYTRQFIRDPARLWQDMIDTRQKQKFQRFIYPKGLVYHPSTGTFGTPELCCIFMLLSNYSGNSSGLVAEVGRFWHILLKEIKEITSLLKEFEETQTAKAA